MSRPTQRHVADAIYFVLLRAHFGRQLFGDAKDFAAFEELLGDALCACKAKLHGGCVTRSAVRLAVQVSDVPVGVLIHRVTGAYARWLRRTYERSGSVFQRNRTMRIRSDLHLLRLVRFIHSVPAREQPAADPATYPWSTHRAYLGRRWIGWLTTATITRLIKRYVGHGKGAYAGYIARGPSREDIERFEGGAPLRRRRNVRQDDVHVSAKPKNSLFDAIIIAVANQLHVTTVEMLSRSSRPEVALARLLATSHAVRSGAVSLRGAGRRFGRSPSTLSEGIRRYRLVRPDLFDASPLTLSGAHQRSVEQRFDPLAGNIRVSPRCKSAEGDRTSEDAVPGPTNSPSGPPCVGTENES